VTDVLLTHSYHLPYDRKQVRKMQPYPPLGTLYAASVLRERGFTVGLFDTMLQAPEEGFAEALKRHQPKIVAVYEDNFNFLSKMCLTRMRDIAFDMLDKAHHAGAVAIAHGSDATDHTREYLERGFEYVLLGEAEWTLEHLTSALIENGDVRGIPGIAYLNSGREVMRTAKVDPKMDRGLPAPARDLINVDLYRRAWRDAHGFFSLNLIGSRGCPFRCNWCAKPIYGDRFHANSAEMVAEEMRELKERYGAEHLWFADDIFGLNRHWALELAEEVEKRQCALPFKIQARADLLTAETARALKRAGCAEVWMGAESGSQNILDAMDKGLRVDEIVTARENLRREGIRACYFLQLGYPGERWDDILRTVRLVRETRPDDIGVSVSYPLPNTRFYERVQRDLGRKRNWRDSEDLSVMFKGAYTDQFYRAVRDALHYEVESWHSRGAERQQESLRLWAEVNRLEPASRNADATVLREESSERFQVTAAQGFVSLKALHLRAGEV
jgi:anaerobic magnesium-protoporphyrin IX monomethyl ester cyclase